MIWDESTSSSAFESNDSALNGLNWREIVDRNLRKDRFGSRQENIREAEPNDDFHGFVGSLYCANRDSRNADLGQAANDCPTHLSGVDTCDHSGRAHGECQEAGPSNLDDFLSRSSHRLHRRLLARKRMGAIERSTFSSLIFSNAATIVGLVILAYRLGT